MNSNSNNEENNHSEFLKSNFNKEQNSHPEFWVYTETFISEPDQEPIILGSHSRWATDIKL